MTSSTPENSHSTHNSGVEFFEPTSTAISNAIQSNSNENSRHAFSTEAEFNTSSTNDVATNQQRGNVEGPTPVLTELFSTNTNVNSVRVETSTAQIETETVRSTAVPTTVSNVHLYNCSKSKKPKSSIRWGFNLESMSFKKDKNEEDDRPAPLILPKTEEIRHGTRRHGGEFGTVYRYCVQESTHFEIAVKRVLRSSVKEVEILQTVAISERLSIIDYYCTLTKPGSDHMWICMEYMDASLFYFYRVMHELYKHQDVPHEQLDLLLFRILRNCIDGLSYLELKGYAHRDIKPDNILINGTSMVKLCDFGISISLEKLKSPYTKEKGTELYIPPRRACDTRDDMWSLGLTLLEIAIGNNPFITPDKNGVRCNRFDFIPPIPDTLCDLMKYCIFYLLQSEPLDRPISYVDILEWDCVRNVPDSPMGEEIQFVEKILISRDPSILIPHLN